MNIKHLQFIYTALLDTRGHWRVGKLEAISTLARSLDTQHEKQRNQTLQK